MELGFGNEPEIEVPEIGVPVVKEVPVDAEMPFKTMD